uniref:Uncharacterized protein n=1 Tax=Pararge aegeria TaxID=116150 RepID=S4PE79_9NEOP
MDLASWFTRFQWLQGLTDYTSSSKSSYIGGHRCVCAYWSVSGPLRYVWFKLRKSTLHCALAACVCTL